MLFLSTTLGVFLLIILSLLILAGNQYKEYIETHKSNFQLLFMAPASLFIVDRFRIIESSKIQGIHHNIIKLYGAKSGLAYTKMFIAQMISAILLSLPLFNVFALLAEGDITLFIYGIVFIPIIVIGLVKDLEKKIKKREQKIIIELPELLNKIILLVNAGETLQKSIMRCVEQKKDIDESPLYIELLQASHELEINRPFQQVLEDFNKRCGVQEVSIFTTTILLNYRKGGGDLLVALRELSNNLWEKRKAIAKTLGEEASSKLVLPMVLIFLVVLIIVATPAILFMKL